MSRTVRESIHDFLEKYPRLAKKLRKLHAVRFWYWKRLIRIRARSQSVNHIDPHKTLWVPPSDIKWALSGILEKEDSSQYSGRANVEGGDWDLRCEPFSAMEVCSGFEEHFNKGKPWQETGYFQRMLDEINAGGHRCGASNESELAGRMSYLDSFYQRIKTEGFKPTEAAKKQDRPDPPAGDEEISARIGRDGDILLEGGRQQMAIAKLLDVPQVPVKVNARHLDWAVTLAHVWSYADAHDGEIYNVIRHPDLSDVPAMHGYERLDLIKSALPSPPGTVLDIGCHWGFYCIELERMGFHCVGVEADERHQHYLRRMREVSGSSFEIVSSSIFNYDYSQDFALVLALYIFHHFLKSRELHDKLVSMLSRLNTDAMILGCHNTDQSEMQNAYMNPAPKDFVAFILEHSCLTKSRHIGTEDGKRELYLLEK